MLLKLYGGRGSIPVSGAFATKYTGSTTCLYIENCAGDPVIVDAGSGIRELGPYLIRNKKHNLTMIFTHYHWDHIQGFPFFGPAFFKSTVLNIHGPYHESNPKKALSFQLTKPYFPTIYLDDMPSKLVFRELKKRLKIGTLTVETITNNHPNYTKGLKFSESGRTAVFLTDNELAPEKKANFKKFVDFVRGADLLIHDAQYTTETYKNHEGWGHSTYEQVMMLASASGVKRIVFTHHDPASNDNFISEKINSLRCQFPGYDLEAAIEGMEFHF